MQYRQQVLSNEVYRAMDQGDWQKMQANWNLANDFAVRHGMPPFNPTPGYQQRVMERFMGAAQGVGMLMGKPKDLPTLAQYRYGTQPGPSPANPWGVGMLMGKPKDLPTLAQYRYGTQPGPSPANP
jgi:hypothetical protein